MTKALHLLTGGGLGGIEVLCREISKTQEFENGFAYVTFGGIVYEQMRGEGASVYPIFELSSAKLSLIKARELIVIGKRYDAVIIHNEDPYLEIYYCMLISTLKIKGIRYVHSCYGDEWLTHRNPVKNLLFRMIMQKTFDVSKRICYVSKAALASAHSVYKVNADKEVIAYNGISDDILHDGGRAIHERERFVGKKTIRDFIHILYIGRLEPIKGTEMLLAAFGELIKEQSAHLTFVGDGSERDKLQKRTAALGIQNDVSFEGFQSKIDKYLSTADIFVYPSICQEVFGISIVEAMAYGLPCIANRVGGIPEIIEDGVNGFLTEEMSVDGLQREMQKVIDLPDDKRRAIGIQARKTAESFNIERCIDSMAALLETI